MKLRGTVSDTPRGFPFTENTVPHWARKALKRERRAWTADERRTLEDLWFRDPKISAEAIGEIMERDAQTIYNKAHQMGLPRRTGRGKKAIKASLKRTKKLPAQDRSGQRRFVGVESPTGPKIVLKPHHPAYREGSTFFPSTVRPVSEVDRLLKSGENSRKIGKIMEKGRWKGMPVFTLTLEERETCPRTCTEWATCYGNNMPFAHRISDDGTLTKRLWGELAALSAANPGGFVVRLHVLGDFYSVSYVEFWRQAMIDFPPLRIFGFTARKPQDPIGAAVLLLMVDERDRFRMRISGGGYETDCSEVVDRPEDATGVRCPAETDPKRSCASCGLCMQSDVTISFVRH